MTASAPPPAPVDPSAPVVPPAPAAAPAAPAAAGALPPAASLALPPAFAARLASLAALGFDGPDAAAFLHGQLSTDVVAMAPGTTGLSSYNSPKGRVLATLLLWRRGPESFVALVATDLAAALRKRLSMFVLRAKVTVSDAAAGKILVGAGGDGAAAALAHALDVARAAGVAAADGDVIALPDGRAVAIAAAEDATAFLADTGLRVVEPAAFEQLGIRAGVPVVTHATQDRFVPQALNLDLLDGVHFRKGCYPGQEIVARMQYLGRLKERLFAFRVAAPAPAAGTALHAADTPEPAMGTVVNAVAVDGGGCELLAVASYDGAARGTLRLGSPAGPLLNALPLPYAVPTPVAPQRVKL